MQDAVWLRWYDYYVQNLPWAHTVLHTTIHGIMQRHGAPPADHWKHVLVRACS